MESFPKFLFNVFKSSEIIKVTTNEYRPSEEQLNTVLPKTCFFQDGKTKVDYVIALPKLDPHIRNDNAQTQLNQFVEQLKNRGLLVEKENGKFHTTLVFLKIHTPHKILTKYAGIYNILISCQNPYYKYKESAYFHWLKTPLTHPRPGTPLYDRAEKTLSGQRPTDLTTSERSKITFEILKRISFTHQGSEVTLKTMIDKEVILQAYPIHDGDCIWTLDGPLTDRQLLFKFWPNPSYFYREQPIHLIEKYYGPKIGFYFALVSLYTKMLLVPTVVGSVTVVAGAIILANEHHYIEDEVCTSNIILCSDQELKTACNLMKIAYLIDNPVTIIYVILCSFWGAVFWSLWQRRQAMLRLRWNMTSVKIDRTMRKEFQENAKTRKSSITGEIEYYIPPSKKVISAILSYFVIIFLVCLFCGIVFLMVEYRHVLQEDIDYDEVNAANEIELFSSAAITAAIILLLDSFMPLVLKGYAKIIHGLTMFRMPRTQAQYNRMFLHMNFIIIFGNHFSSLFYLAFIKGFFHTYPGDLSDSTFIRRLQSDLCKPAGCLVDLGSQLVTLMVLKSITNIGFDVFGHFTGPWQKFKVPVNKLAEIGQWEKDFALAEFDDSTIDQLFTELVLQYSFITFFNASCPVVGFIALVHNLAKVRYDAWRFLKDYRRPIIQQVPDIEGWNHVLQAVTVFGCISNSFIVAFRTYFVQRTIYRMNHGGLEGYINSTLSKFAIKDLAEETIIDHKEEKYCFYHGFRYPPEHEKKYQHTERFWYNLAIRAIYFIVIEKVTFVLSLVLAYLIPEVPRKVKVKLEHDEKLLRELREARMDAPPKLSST